jgi:hypothetical protein
MPIPTGPHRVVKTLRPTQAGALKLARRYGPALVCVRYRHDAAGSTRYTTVELIVEEVAVQRRVSDRTMVGVRIAWGEATLSAKAKSLGARWDKPSQLWRMSMRTARLLDVTDRIQQTWL